MMERNKKWITLAVLAAFIWLSHISTAPLRAESGYDHSTMAVEKVSTAKPVIKKKSILPLVLIGVGVLAAAAAVYFLVIKKDKERVHDDFTSAADPLWLPRTPSAWSVAGGYYICQKALGVAPAAWWEWSLYNRSWSKPDYTITTRMKVSDHLGPFGLLLVDNANMDSVGGYQIMFSGDNYFVRKVNGWNYFNSTAAGFTWIKTWTSSPAILGTLNAWNTFKLVKTGSEYRLYANETLVYTFIDAAYDPRYVAVAVHTQTQAMNLQVDSFYVDMN